MKREDRWFSVAITAVAFAPIAGVLGFEWLGVGLTALALVCGSLVLRANVAFLVSQHTLSLVVMSVIYLGTNAIVLGRLGGLHTTGHAARLLLFGHIYTALGVQVVRGTPENARRLERAFFLAGLAASLGALGRLGTAPAALSISTIELGRSSAVGLLVVVFAGWMRPTLRLAGVVLLVAGVVAAGSRGAVAGLCVALVAGFIYRLRGALAASRLRIAIASVILASVLVGVGAVVLDSVKHSRSDVLAERASRLESLSDIEVLLANRSVTFRTEGLYANAMELFWANPLLGHGISNGVVEDEYVYAHNIYLELAAGAGIVGIVIFAILSIVILSSFATKERPFVPVFGLFFLTVAQFSGDLSINRILFVAVGMSAASVVYRHRLQDDPARTLNLASYL